jgi:hypothetical protein
MTLELTNDCTVVANQDTLSSAVGDETVILHFSAGTYFGLDDVGTRVWQLIEQPRTVGEILDRLMEEYDVEAGPCRVAVARLLEELTENGLVTVHAPTSA